MDAFCTPAPGPATAAVMRPEILAIAPDNIKKLPVDPDRGYPVPFFVGWLDGKPEFRGADPAKMVRCLIENLCWVCGQKLGHPLCFVIGPMCTVNRVSSEPPSHRECAVFSARACPFLSKPQMVRREANMPEDMGAPAGVMLKHNPGVTALWTCRGFERVADPSGRPLFALGDPISVQWFKEGRPASRDEVQAGMAVGYPALQAAAESEGPDALADLEVLRRAAERWLPPEGTP